MEPTVGIRENRVKERYFTCSIIDEMDQYPLYSWLTVENVLTLNIWQFLVRNKNVTVKDKTIWILRKKFHCLFLTYKYYMLYFKSLHIQHLTELVWLH